MLELNYAMYLGNKISSIRYQNSQLAGGLSKDEWTRSCDIY